MLACMNASAQAPPHSRTVRECATCHPAQANGHPATSMAHAMELVSETTILREHPVLTFTEGKYSYRIERKGDQSMYSVTDGQENLTVPIGWSFGLGVAGQTYVFEKDGQLYESRVSYYSQSNALDLTIGARNLKPTNILQAAGRFIGPDEKVRCFGCHSTNGVQGMKLSLDTMTAGVQCERCHGSTDNHLAGLKAGNAQTAAMKHLRTLSTEDLSNFCGQCHRTWEEVASGGTLGVSNVRFQPYRLTNSRCYDTEDKRISCLACHDPHQEINRADASYDNKCQACHAGGKPTAKACRVSKNNCVSCHMPKFELPDSHHKFTDHEIRVVRANAAYPN
jgi:Zn finger protein HypA/HybF involved in hydrogenase expression